MQVHGNLGLTHTYRLLILLQESLYKKLEKQESNIKLSPFLLKFLVSSD